MRFLAVSQNIVWSKTRPIAMAVYDHRNVSGWTLINALSEGNDQVGLYQRASTCVVAFAGTNDWSDWFDNLNAYTTRKCGLDLHAGLYHALEATVHRRGWLGIVNTLVGSTCGEVVLSGHSAGGAVASILAACANQNGGLRASFSHFPAFTVDRLYTIGAPGISKQRINNDQERNGCFSGMRVVNYDGASYDPVPYVNSHWGFLHPPLELTRTKMTTSWWGRSKVTKESYSCTSNEALVYPSTVRPWYIPLKSSHTDYLLRLEALVDTQGIVKAQR
eukprot:TRINITY_DN3579_c0_g1_i3.p1 TRINITY_DN3579_c0_g1~~TRINITY_DN3579_c0_g1_i3.p1  ORF type:complete len:276 (+),score=12.75 TRINITY_DN3579_c0_g1_i3:196-1023(+)